MHPSRAAALKPAADALIESLKSVGIMPTKRPTRCDRQSRCDHVLVGPKRLRRRHEGAIVRVSISPENPAMSWPVG